MLVMVYPGEFLELQSFVWLQRDNTLYTGKQEEKKV